MDHVAHQPRLINATVCEEVSESECREYYDHDRNGAFKQTRIPSHPLRNCIHLVQPAVPGFENPCHQKYFIILAQFENVCKREDTVELSSQREMGYRLRHFL